MRSGSGSALLLLAVPWPLVLVLLWVEEEEEEAPPGVSSGFDDSPSVKCAGRPLACRGGSPTWRSPSVAE